MKLISNGDDYELTLSGDMIDDLTDFTIFLFEIFRFYNETPFETHCLRVIATILKVMNEEYEPNETGYNVCINS